MEELLTVEEVARLYRVHEMTVRRYIRRGRLRAVKAGGRIRVPSEEVVRFLQPAVRAKGEKRDPVPELARVSDAAAGGAPGEAGRSPTTGADSETAWDELVRLGEEIGRGWCAPVPSWELLSQMRR